MPGDIITAEVYAKYLDPDDDNWSVALGNFIGAIASGTAPLGTVVDGGATGSLGNYALPFVPTDHGSETGSAPKAYLNYIVFDRNMNPIPSQFGFDRISTSARESGGDEPHDRLAFDGPDQIVIKEPGYVYIYLSNESDTPVEVYFDDFKVVHMKGPIVSSQDYYPFGLAYNSYQRENSVANKHLFQDKELQDELNLNVYDFDWRQYDPAIGRTTTQDPHADNYWELSPYSFFANNSINTLDPMGMDTIPVNQVDPHTIDPNNDVILLDEVVVTASDDSNDNDQGSEAAAATGALTLTGEKMTWKEIGFRFGATISTPAVLLTTIFTLIPTSTGNGEMEALRKMEEDRLKGGKQGRRDRSYGLPNALFDWWHNGGGKDANGGEDIGYEEGQTTPEDALEQWEGLGKPTGSKPRE